MFVLNENFVLVTLRAVGFVAVEDLEIVDFHAYESRLGLMSESEFRGIGMMTREKELTASWVKHKTECP